MIGSGQAAAWIGAQGFYLWKSRADAEKVYTAVWRRMIADRYGAESEITFFESPVIVDNEMETVQVAAE